MRVRATFQRPAKEARSAAGEGGGGAAAAGGGGAGAGAGAGVGAGAGAGIAPDADEELGSGGIIFLGRDEMFIEHFLECDELLMDGFKAVGGDGCRCRRWRRLSGSDGWNESKDERGE